MKKILLVVASISALALAGCATTHEQQTVPPAPVPDVRVNSTAAMVAECAAAIKDLVIAPAGDAASKVAGVGAIERLCGAGGNQIAMQMQRVEQPPQSLGGVLWGAALQVADIAMRGYGIKAQRDVAIIQSNNQASTTIASYGAFSSMGSSIASAGTAGYRYVQAPGTVTTNSINGTGVIGSGSYTGPVTTTTTTTRTCSAGAAGAGGGTTTGAAGGAGGPATC